MVFYAASWLLWRRISDIEHNLKHHVASGKSLLSVVVARRTIGEEGVERDRGERGGRRPRDACCP